MPRRKVARRLLVAAVTAGRCQLMKIRRLLQALQAVPLEDQPGSIKNLLERSRLVSALTATVLKKPKTRYEMLMSDDDLGVDP